MCLTSSSSHVQSFIDTVLDLFMFQHITEPTRFRGDATPYLLELVFTNNENMVYNLKYLPGLGNSDHLCISFDLDSPVCQSTNSDTAHKYNVYRTDFNKMS